MNITELSKVLGLSVSTISKALNGYHGVSEKTRKLVEDAAAEYGYHPSASARSLRRRDTERIGLLNPASGLQFWVTQMTADYFVRVLRGIAAEAEVNRNNLMLYSSQRVLEPEVIERIIRSREVDGLIVMGGSDIRGAVKMLRESDIPFAVFGKDLSIPDVSFIEPDYIQCGYLGTRHLAELGHRRIAYIGQDEDRESNPKRLKGYHSALDEFGIPFDEQLVVSAPFAENGGYVAMEELLSRNVPFTAAMFFCDNVFFDAVPLLKQQGIKVPRDLSVVGIDNTDRGRWYDPALTSVHTSLEEMGSQAVKMLLKMIRSDEKPVFKEISPVHLNVRSSTEPVG